jgi:hypothetical protein
LTTPPVQRCQSAGRSPPSSLSLKELAWHKQSHKEKAQSCTKKKLNS